MTPTEAIPGHITERVDITRGVLYDAITPVAYCFCCETPHQDHSHIGALHSFKRSQQILILFSDGVSNAIRSRRRADHKWLLDKNNSDKFLEFYRSRHLTTNILNQAEKNYFYKLVHDNHTKTKKIFAICNNLLGRSQDHPLLPGFTDKELANISAYTSFQKLPI